MRNDIGPTDMDYYARTRGWYDEPCEYDMGDGCIGCDKLENFECPYYEKF